MSEMICQQVFAISRIQANHLANKYALEYNSEGESGTDANHSCQRAVGTVRNQQKKCRKNVNEKKLKKM